MQQLSSTSLASSISPAARRPLTVSTARPPLVGSSSSFAPPQQRQRPATEAARRASVEMPSPPSSSRGRPGTGLVAAVQSSGGPASQELAFDRVYDHLIHEESTFVANLDRMITLHEHSRARKTKALYNEWESEIFDKVSDQIAQRVDQRDPRVINERHNQLMQDYLDVTQRKEPFGVFRDIIIEAEYDPMSCHTNHIKYQNRIRHDPCKLELRQHAHKPMDAMGRSEFSKPRGTGVTPRLPVGLWDKLDSTPYGRSEKLLPRLDAAASYRLHNRVTQNEFQVERGRAVLQREIPLGKRCFYGAR